MAIFGVSHGNGNDGVSQLYPNYYVKTDKPFDLAFGAMVDQFERDYMTRYAKLTNVEGEAEYTIHASIYDPIGSQGYSEANGCWKIVEVFPVAEDDLREGAPVYDSIDLALSTAALLRVKRYA